MQFHIDIDSGNYLAGWVLPDNPSATPTIAVSIAKSEPVKIQANVFRKDLKDLGIHNTGMLGFEFSQATVPGLDASARIEIRDADTNMLIFRRFREAEHLPLKMLRYDLSAMPQLPIDSAVADRFALSYGAIERHSFDTLFGILNNSSTPSVYLSGRPYLNRYLQLLRDRGFKTALMLRDPIEELAEKLIFIKFAVSGRGPEFVADHLTGLTLLFEMSAKIDFNDDNSLVSTMNTLSDSEREAISNPFVRLLACAADEIAQDHHVSIALENLANLNLVGIQSRFHHFKTELANMIGKDVIGDQKLATISNVPIIAKKLGRLRSVNKLLALDIKLYRFAQEAINKIYE